MSGWRWASHAQCMSKPPVVDTIVWQATQMNSGQAAASSFFKLDGADKERDLFPVPLISERPLCDVGSSQSQRRRVAKFNRQAKSANEIIGSLNEMFAPAPVNSRLPVELTSAQRAAQMEVLRQVKWLKTSLGIVSVKRLERFCNPASHTMRASGGV